MSTSVGNGPPSVRAEEEEADDQSASALAVIGLTAVVGLPLLVVGGLLDLLGVQWAGVWTATTVIGVGVVVVVGLGLMARADVHYRRVERVRRAQRRAETS